MGFMCVSLLLSVPTPAKAIPTLFTDRAAFDAAVGSYALLTLDEPSQVSFDAFHGVKTATYEQLLAFTFDNVGGDGVNPDGTVTLGNTGLGAFGTVLQPVTAFGFDVVKPFLNGTLSIADIVAGSARFQVSLAGVSFLGVVSASPFLARVEYATPIIHTLAGPEPAFPFTIDNVAITTVPEPSSVMLLLAGVLGLVSWSYCQRKKNSVMPSA